MTDHASRSDVRLPRHLLLMAALLWLSFGTLYAILMFYAMKSEGMVHSPWVFLKNQVPIWGSWALLTPAVWRLASRRPLRGSWSSRAALEYGANATFVILVWIVIATLVTKNLVPLDWASKESYPQAFVNNLRSRGLIAVIVYLGILACAHWWLESRRARDREIASVKLESDLARAELRALQLQLQPHFLFNTLHAISGLVRDSRNDDAVEMIAALSDLLRHVLENGSRQTVPLEEEMDFIERYLELQKLRFGDRLEVGFAVDPSCRRALLPNLILQPLVENAVTHGLAGPGSTIRVEIDACRQNDELIASVFDDGPPADPARADHRTGLRNTASRLTMLYGDAAELSLVNTDGGVRASVRIPFMKEQKP